MQKPEAAVPQERPWADEARPPSPARLDYEAIRRQIARTVSRVCPRWLAAHAEDIVQAAVMRVLAVERRGEGMKDLGSSYLWSVAYTATIDEIRTIRSRRKIFLDDSEDTDVADPAAPDPEHAEMGREIGEAIRECLGRLIRPRRLAVTLHLQGVGVPDAARILGWDRKRTENLVVRGVADLRVCLASKGLRP